MHRKLSSLETRGHSWSFIFPPPSGACSQPVALWKFLTAVITSPRLFCHQFGPYIHQSSRTLYAFSGIKFGYLSSVDIDMVHDCGSTAQMSISTDRNSCRSQGARWSCMNVLSICNECFDLCEIRTVGDYDKRFSSAN